MHNKDCTMHKITDRSRAEPHNGSAAAMRALASRNSTAASSGAPTGWWASRSVPESGNASKFKTDLVALKRRARRGSVSALDELIGVASPVHRAKDVEDECKRGGITVAVAANKDGKASCDSVLLRSRLRQRTPSGSVESPTLVCELLTVVLLGSSVLTEPARAVSLAPLANSERIDAVSEEHDWRAGNRGCSVGRTGKAKP